MRILKVTFLVLVLVLVAASAPAAEKQPITIDDLYRFDAPTSAAFSNRDAVVYVRQWADRERRETRYSLWLAEGSAENARPLEPDEPDARGPLLSPDGKWIAFTSTRPLPDGSPAFPPVPPYSDPATDIWLMPADGGTAIPLAGKNKPYGRVFTDSFYGHLAFSPDGRRLVFVADDGRDPRTPAEIANQVQIVRDDQGEGYEGYGAAQVWIADLADSPTDVAALQVTRVTDDDVWYGDPQWWPDGRSLVVHANRTDDRESVRYSINKNYDLWRIHLDDGRLEQLTDGPGPEVSPRISPDGQRLLCLSIPRKGSHFDSFNLLTIDLADEPRATVLFDHHGEDADEPPHLPPSFPLPRDCWLTSSVIYYNAADGCRSRRPVIDLNHGPASLANAAPESHGPALARVAELRKLLPAGNRFLDERRVARGRVVRWKSADGLEIEGIFTPPADPAARPPYPLILYPHGGPHSRSTLGFDFTVQVFAASGYAVFQPNFRGSAGYGQRFIDADRFDLGGRDMQDILAGINYLIEGGAVDRERQFVYGVSYGGFMTCWLLAQTHQFRAAAPQNAVTDLTAMWGLSDLPSWTEWEFGGRPWEVPEAMRDRSPLTYASQVVTPTLILHASGDRRCPLPMGQMFYQALKSSGVETQMVIYPDEGHAIRSLPHREDVLRRVLDWFARHDVRAAGGQRFGNEERRAIANPGTSSDQAAARHLVFQVDGDFDNPDMKLLIPEVRRRLKMARLVRRFSVRLRADDRLEVMVWGADEETVSDVVRTVTRPATLRVATLANPRDHKALIERARLVEQKLEEDGTVLAEWFPVAFLGDGTPKDIGTVDETVTRQRTRNGKAVTEYLVVDDAWGVWDHDLAQVSRVQDAGGSWGAEFRMSPMGSRLLFGLTHQLRPNADGFTRRLAIVWEGQLHAAPVVRSPIMGHWVLTGQFTETEATELVLALQSGRLPWPLKLEPDISQ